MLPRPAAAPRAAAGASRTPVPTAPSTTGTTSTSNLDAPAAQLWIGAFLGANQYATVEFLQVIAYKGHVTDAQATGLESYLKNKYGF